MLEIKGKVNTAICYARVIEDEAIEQIRRMCDYEFTAGSRIRIMPDVHAGKGCTIGTTMTIVDKAVPNVVGVDIGCGMYTMCLGGGNHFIEVDLSADGTAYLVIHSGSRNLGLQVAKYYQNLAVDLNKGKEEYLAKREALIAEYKAAGRRTEIQAALKKLKWQEKQATIPEDLCFVYGRFLEDYLHDVDICQRFARQNRELMAKILLERTGLTAGDAFHTVHNYINTEEMILRKGAIVAHKDELVLIPINMRDGSVLARGKGNPEWNYSAPHGAGRIMSRTMAKERLGVFLKKLPSPDIRPREGTELNHSGGFPEKSKNCLRKSCGSSRSLLKIWYYKFDIFPTINVIAKKKTAQEDHQDSYRFFR